MATNITTDNVKKLSEFDSATLTDEYLMPVTNPSGSVGYKTTLAALRSKIMEKSVWLTQDEYDALVDAGTVDATVEYNIYEEEA